MEEQAEGLQGPLRIEIPGLQEGLLQGLSKCLDLFRDGYESDRITVMPTSQVRMSISPLPDSVVVNFLPENLVVKARIIGSLWKIGWVSQAVITHSSITVKIDGLPDVEIV